MSDSWYFTRDEKRLGPFSTAQMQGMAAAGQLMPQDMVLHEGAQKWVAAGSLPELFPPAPPAIPEAVPVPPHAVRAEAPLDVGVPNSPPTSPSEVGGATHQPSSRRSAGPGGRSTLLVVAAVASLLVGLLGVTLGLLGLHNFLSLLEQSQFSTPVAQYIRSLNREIPGWIYLEISKAALVLLLGLGLVLASVGLLLRRRWAWWYGIAYGPAAVLLHTGYLAFQFGWVMPETSNWLARQRQQPPDELAVLVGVVGVAGLFIVHGAALVVILLSRRVKKSFARVRVGFSFQQAK